MSHDNAEMERGIAQVLANFVPGDLFDYGRRGITMQVDNWAVQEMEADQRRIAKHIQGQVGSYRNSDQPPWNNLEETDIEVFRPHRVFGEIYPTTMVCERCNYVSYRDSA